MRFSDLRVRLLFYFTSFFRSEEATGHCSLGLEQTAGLALWFRRGKEIQPRRLRKLNLYFRVFVNAKVPGIWITCGLAPVSVTLVNQGII